MSTKPLVFISHISEEREIAIALKALIEKSFLGMIDTFVSTDPKSIAPGNEWLNMVRQSLTDCKIEVVLASPTSLKRSWINFEAGAGWIRKIPVVPICHSGVTPSTLPNPLNEFQAITATEEVSLKNLLHVLADALKCEVPETDVKQFIKVVSSYESDSKEREKQRLKHPDSEFEGLLPYEMLVLATTAHLCYHPDEPTSLSSVRDAMPQQQYPTYLFPLAIKILERQELIRTDTERVDYDDYYYRIFITDAGWSWINQHTEEIDRLPAPLPKQSEPIPTRQQSVQSTEDDTPF